MTNDDLDKILCDMKGLEQYVLETATKIKGGTAEERSSLVRERFHRVYNFSQFLVWISCLSHEMEPLFNYLTQAFCEVMENEQIKKGD